GSGTTEGVDRLCQGSLRWTRTGSRLRRTLYAPGSNLEQSPPGYRKRACHFPLQGLSRLRLTEDHDSHGRGVHSPLPDARPAAGLPSHPLLRLPGQSLSATEARRLSSASANEPPATAEDRRRSADGLSRPARGSHRSVPEC